METNYNLQKTRIIIIDCYDIGDALETSGYKVEGLHNANHDLGKLYIALETALHVLNKSNIGLR